MLIEWQKGGRRQDRQFQDWKDMHSRYGMCIVSTANTVNFTEAFDMFQLFRAGVTNDIYVSMDEMNVEAPGMDYRY